MTLNLRLPTESLADGQLLYHGLPTIRAIAQFSGSHGVNTHVQNIDLYSVTKVSSNTNAQAALTNRVALAHPSFPSFVPDVMQAHVYIIYKMRDVPPISFLCYYFCMILIGLCIHKRFIIQVHRYNNS